MILNNAVEVTTFYNLNLLKKIFWNTVFQSIYYILLTFYSEATLLIMSVNKKVRKNKKVTNNINKNIKIKQILKQQKEQDMSG